MSFFKPGVLVTLSIVVLASCKTTTPLIDENFKPSPANADSIVTQIPNYSASLNSVEGSGRAIVSEPGNSDRVTINFAADTTLTYMSFKNRIGIEGGELLADQDSILIYNKVDKEAQKIAARDGRLTSLNELASINLLDLLHFKIPVKSVTEIFESESQFLLLLPNDGTAILDKHTLRIIQIKQGQRSGLPYSLIMYENYAEIDGYTLPRKITIFSADGESKVIFQVRSLQINPPNLTLEVDIPENIYIQRL